MRLFLAVNPGEQLRDELAARIDTARRRCPGSTALRWTSPDAWHLTPQFLGEWPEDRICALEQGLRQLVGNGIIRLKPGALGGFPDLYHPRVLFLHLDSEGKAECLGGD